MGRAELRRQAKSRKKEQEKVNKVLKNAGFPEFRLPPAPLKTTNLSDQEVANITGTKIAVLEQWRKEQTEEIRKACILEAQEKLELHHPLQRHHIPESLGRLPVRQGSSRIYAKSLFGKRGGVRKKQYPDHI